MNLKKAFKLSLGVLITLPMSLIVGNEILAIKLSASNFNGKLIMWGIMIMLFTFMLMEVFGFSAWLGIDSGM